MVWFVRKLVRTVFELACGERSRFSCSKSYCLWSFVFVTDEAGVNLAKRLSKIFCLRLETGNDEV